MFARRVIAGRAAAIGRPFLFWIFVHNEVLGHDFDSRYARRSIKGSKDADDHLVSTKFLSYKNG